MVTDHPDNTTGAVGGTADFSITAAISDGDTADISYLWQVSLDDGNNWSGLSGTLVVWP